ncbi:MAG: hypothetical protein AMJ69_05395 [Gammaproteobacteria bacterium SG8_47]|nr:MAG: hypothetical protein AMJ69_05395 [Gammaproteobacteria bacterium SG8_47]
MRVEDIAVEVRPRQEWEAADLGFSMARQWWREVWIPFVVVTASLAVLLHLVLFDRPWLAVLIVWWLKPLLDRIPLFVVSRALFGATPGVGQTLLAVPGLFRRHVIKALTLYRLDPSRSFNLPVWQLEHLAGTARRERLRVLHKTTAAAPAKLTIACMHLEGALTFGLIGLLFIMLPEHLLAEAWYAFGEQDALWTVILGNALWVVAFCIIEPFYVAGGFALYINRRSHLEAWDIDLAFRRLANRIRRTTPGKGAAVVACVLVLCVGMGTPGDSQAENEALGPQTQLTERDQAKQLIEQILSQPEFARSEEITWWFPKGWDAEDSDAEQSASLFGWGLQMAQLIEFAFWLAAAVVVGLAIYHLSKRWPAQLSPRRQGTAAPEALFGLDIRPESLPPDLAMRAWQLWQAGHASEALSLLYRGALSHLVAVRGLSLPPSATEGDCLASARQAVDSLGADTLSYFECVVRTWQALAYAQRRPDSSQVQALCSAWPQHFGGGS